MAIHSSAIKRNKQNKKLNAANRQKRSTMRTAIKDVKASTVAKDAPKATAGLKKATSIIAKAGNKGLLHKNNVARKISRLTKSVNAISKE